MSRIFNFPEGEILLIDKPFRWTSFDVVKKIRWMIFKTTNYQPPTTNPNPRTPNSKLRTKVGHAGTLDPLATGLLIVCTGKFTKKIQDIQQQEKEYTGIITLGATTPSYDLETPIDKIFSLENISEEKIFETAKKLTGTYQQIPPVFSAKKIDGKRAYEHARKGKTVEMKSSEITIKEFEITKIILPEIQFRVVCSKGTYLRSVAKDFGELLNNGAYLAQLCRTRIGNYKLADAFKIEELERMLKSENNL